MGKIDSIKNNGRQYFMHAVQLLGFIRLFSRDRCCQTVFYKTINLIQGHSDTPKNVIFTCVRPVFYSRKFPNLHLLTWNKATLLPFLHFVAPWQSRPTPWRFHWSRACSRATRRWSTSGRRGIDGDRRSRWFRECRSEMPNSAAECRSLRKGTFY